MSSTAMLGTNPEQINIQEVLSFPLMREQFPNEKPELFRPLLDKDNRVIGEIRVFSNRAGNEMVMVVFVPSNTTAELTGGDVDRMADGMNDVANAVMERYPQTQDRDGKLHLLEFILSPVIGAGIAQMGKLTRFQFLMINGSTTPVFNRDVKFKGAILSLAAILDIGFTRGVNEGQQAFDRKLRTAGRNEMVQQSNPEVAFGVELDNSQKNGLPAGLRSSMENLYESQGAHVFTFATYTERLTAYNTSAEALRTKIASDRDNLATLINEGQISLNGHGEVIGQLETAFNTNFEQTLERILPTGTTGRNVIDRLLGVGLARDLVITLIIAYYFNKQVIDVVIDETTITPFSAVGLESLITYCTGALRELDSSINDLRSIIEI